MILPDDLFAMTTQATDQDWTPLKPTTLPSALLQPAPRACPIEDNSLSSAVCNLGSAHLQSVAWDCVRSATTSNLHMTLVLDLVESGSWPPEEDHPPPVLELQKFRDDLHTMDGVLYRNRVVIPPTFCQDVLNTLHSAHQGVTSMLSRAEVSIFWPGITNAIRNMRNQFRHCNNMAPSQPAAPPSNPHRLTTHFSAFALTSSPTETLTTSL